MKTVYEARCTATGGRNGHVTSSDGVIDLRLAIPREMGGPGGALTNPEQMFAAGYAACFDSALAFVASKQEVKLTGARVTVNVGIGPNGQGGFALAVRLSVGIPSLPPAQAQELAAAAHAVCPYSNAIRGNVPVELEVSTEEIAA